MSPFVRNVSVVRATAARTACRRVGVSVNAGGGRVVTTVGDEILFTADALAAGALIDVD